MCGVFNFSTVKFEKKKYTNMVKIYEYYILPNLVKIYDMVTLFCQNKGCLRRSSCVSLL